MNKKIIITGILFIGIFTISRAQSEEVKPRIIVTSDGEIDDECSMVRFLLYANEWDIEGIITSSSQYHWHGHRWAGDDWIDPFLNAYEKIHPNLILHDKAYPSADYLKSINFLGNVEDEGEMESITPGSQHIVKVLLDETDNNPIWLQAWGGTNTIARALKSIEEEHPDKMEQVAKKIRFYFIWEQDNTYQKYILPHWGKYNIPTIISDQFMAVAYFWDKIMPKDKLKFFNSEWMTTNILENHGPLCSLYEAVKSTDDKEGFSAGDPKTKGSFRSEGDSPAFFHMIPTGLRSLESPGYGGWGGRYVNVRNNTWLDPVPEPNYSYPEGRWFTQTAWGRSYMRNTYPENQTLMEQYFKPITRWADALQNDFAARADWCIESYDNANHPPVVKLNSKLDITSTPGATIELDAKHSYDPDGNALTFSWWNYSEAGSYTGTINLSPTNTSKLSLQVPADAKSGDTIHIVCEVNDNGSPKLTRYQRVIITVQ
ncbi:DUF1593 domain-containing protein [Maribacter sp. MAR_2009_72]|uniref:DUF1593 domain-containing protein n=1 Tax=Maribacter sp. MAR_2009_72 TaxID=1250050 RepID=UPI00119B7B12|nr:DUF1593 domain-containing protein [Maribacter sp. MAR_2009_72]TVZ17073.1 uncharacterized protein DUF1593 [Maribacter sp. MAR_2009_72]